MMASRRKREARQIAPRATHAENSPKSSPVLSSMETYPLKSWYSRHRMTINMPRQTKATRWIDPDKAERDVFVLGDRHRSLETPWHSHERAQLIHVSEGVLTVRTKDGLWMVPPQRAV